MVRGTDVEKGKKGVLFVCYGNSCRSIMAEALTIHYWGELLRVASAGIVPLGHITAHTVEALRETNVSLESLRSKGLTEIDLGNLQFLVSLTRSPVEAFLPSGFTGKIIHRHVKDPYGEGLGAFRQARDTIARMVTQELPLWLKLDAGRMLRSR
jgi:arsenate reductase (thioredoxin)